jgi:hypothetical protein
VSAVFSGRRVWRWSSGDGEPSPASMKLHERGRLGKGESFEGLPLALLPRSCIVLFMSSTANTTKCTTCKGTGTDTNCDYDNNGNAIDIVTITCEDCDWAGGWTYMTEAEVQASFQAFLARRRK